MVSDAQFRRPPPKSKGKKSKRGRKAFWLRPLLKTALLVALLLGASGYLLFGKTPSQDPESKFNYEKIKASLASETTVYADDGKTALGSFFDATHRRYVPHDEMPPELIEAIVAAEDSRFFKHKGVDPLGIARALAGNIKAGRVVAGGSTLTQQTAKNLFGRTDRTYKAKWREFKDAVQLERHFSKKEILEFYLNQFHVAGNGRGVGIAAKHFFDRDLNQLNLKEIAFIAGSVKGPQLYDPHSQKNDSLKTVALKRAEIRTAYVLRRMKETHSITEEEEKRALADTLRFKQGQFRGRSDRILQQVLAQMESPWMQMKMQQADIEDWTTEGLQIVTTLKGDLQRSLQTVFNDSLQKMEQWLGWSGKELERMEGGLVVLHNGEIAASVGGRDPEGFDRVWEAKRLFGSVWKPLLIAHALELGWSEEALLENEDNMVEDGNRFYWPRPDHTLRGKEVTLRWMAVKSENIAAVRLLEHLLDPLDKSEVERLAQKFRMAQKSLESEEEYKKRLDEMGIVLNNRAEEQMRFYKAKLTLSNELKKSGREAAAHQLLHLPFGGEAFEAELSAQEKKSKSTDLIRRSKNWLSLRKNLQEIEMEPEKLEFLCSSNRTISLRKKGAPADSSARICFWDSLPEEEKPYIKLSGDLTIDDLQKLRAYMGFPLNSSERIQPENLFYLPQFRSLLARKSFVEFCSRIGIEQRLPLVASLPLGTGEVSLIELARAYQSILTGKRYRGSNPEFSELLIRSVKFHNGAVIFVDSVRSTPVLSEEISAKMRSILQGAVRDGTGRRADRALTIDGGAGGKLKLPIAGKTGTTNNFRTVSFVGGLAAPADGGVFKYNDGWTIASWVGTDLNAALRGKRGALSGASGALPVWIGAVQKIAQREEFSKAIDPLDLSQQLTGRVSVELGVPTHIAQVDPLRGTLSSAPNSVESELCGEAVSHPESAEEMEGW